VNSPTGTPSASAEAPARLGPYPIEREIGRGGMGVVYLARDPRLDRAIAIKVLPADLAAGGERLARFEREARILAQLRHPNIAGIHSLEEDGATVFLTLEYVEGETLADRLARGPLPPIEALEVGRQIAAAVEAAHERGVIHRDLKPGNVKITPSGDVRVLDFGLAKEIGPLGAPNTSMSPTLTYASTQLGLVLGTAAYMSPEQARGRELDRRTDIWSFGCVLYECLTGRQAFAGETVSDVIAGVLEREPDLEALPREVPDRVRELIARCLAKDPMQRLRDIGDARITLDEVLATRSASGRLPAARDTGRFRGRAANPGRVARIAAISAAVAALVGAFVGAALVPHADRELRVVSIALPGGWKLRGSSITRDGRYVTVAAVPPGGGNLAHMYARPIGAPDFHELPGTASFQNSWLAGDQRSLLVTDVTTPGSDERRLMRVPIDGDAPPTPVCDWKPTWTNLAAPSGLPVLVSDGALSYVILGADGQPSPSHAIHVAGATGVTRVDLTSQSVPNGHGALVNVISYDARGWHYAVGVLDPPSGRVEVVVDDGGNAVWLGSGLLAFARGRLVYAIRFDPSARKTRGREVLAWSGLRTPWDASPGAFRVTEAGDLYHAPAGTNAGRAMALLGPNGKLDVVSGRRTFNGAPDLSPDGHSFVTDIVSARGLDELWIGDVRQPDLRRLTHDDEADCSSPVWSRDGSQIAYRRHAENARDGVYVADAATGATHRVLGRTRTSFRPLAWRPDGALLLVEEIPGANRLVVLPAGATDADTTKLTALHTTDADERGARISRDGRWLAWIGNASGTGEAYVAPLAGGTPVRIPTGGAWACQWALDRPVLYVSDPRGRLLATTVTESGGTLHAAPPDSIADLNAVQAAAWAAATEGRVLISVRSDDETELPHYQLVLHWLDEVKRRMRAAESVATR